ncbi:MAG: C-type lectin domain-containing protein [Polyangiaceae bacterium]
MRVSIANTRLPFGALLLLGLGACGAAHDADLFRSSGTLAGGGGAGNASGDAAYAGGAGKPQGEGGEGSVPPNGGAENGGSGPGGTGGAIYAGGGGSKLSNCSQFGRGANYFEETEHCYLVVTEPATFAAAEANCEALGAHLATLANEAENDFAWGLNSEAHWIGSEDGNGPNISAEGTFTWVTGEPFTYTNWSSNQPNTSSTDCGETGLAGHCYEHCVYQWTGGQHDGQWNDRFCLYPIAAICEWDSGK